MANKSVSRVRTTNMGPASRQTRVYRMFGNTGLGLADVGGWINVSDTQWKGFQLQPLAAGDSIGGTTTVVIEGAFELDDETDQFSAVGDANTIATLDNSTRYGTIETPYRFVRARVTAFAGDTSTVGLVALT